MIDSVYYVLCIVLAGLVLLGISMMSKVKSALWGNLLSCACMAAAIVLTIIRYDFSGKWLWLLVGLVPAAGLLCDAQWRQGATRVWGGFTPSRTTETGHRLSWETFPAVRQWVCGPQKDLGATRQEPPRAVPSHRCL